MLKLTTLPNGLRVLTINNPNYTTTTVAVVNSVGSRYESKDINGISHFLEHLAFKGTKNRDVVQIATEAERLGANVNAYTSQDKTVYHISGMSEHVETFVDILSDIMLNSIFPEDEINRERGAVLQEIHRYNDDPQSLCFSYFNSTAYPNQPIGRPILGSPEFVKNVQRDDFVKYFNEHYNASNMIVVAAGNVDSERFVALVEKYFDGVRKGNETTFEPAQYGGGYSNFNKNFEQVNLALGFPICSARDEDRYTYAVLGTALGGGMSSPLFQEVREKRGLAYAVSSFSSFDYDSGELIVYVGTTRDYVDEVVTIVCDELNKIRGGVDSENLTRAVNQLKFTTYNKMQQPTSVAMTKVDQLLTHGQFLELDEVIKNIEAGGDNEKIRVCAQKMLSAKPTLSIVGNTDPDTDYYKLVTSSI